MVWHNIKINSKIILKNQLLSIIFFFLLMHIILQIYEFPDLRLGYV